MIQKNPHKLKPPDRTYVMTGLKPAVTQASALNSKKKKIYSDTVLQTLWL